MENKFEYTYVAPTESERKETEAIRKRYLPEPENLDKLTRLRNLDEKVKRFPMILSLSLGVVGTLIFGLGLTMILEWSMIVWGAAVAVVGMILLALAYPAYKISLTNRKRKYGAEILKLSEEILNESRKDDN